MAKKFSELRAKMSPESRARSQAKALKDIAKIEKKEVSFPSPKESESNNVPSDE